MTIELHTNRYDRLTPNSTIDNGVTVSCPYYITLTSDQKKYILNEFRKVKTKELLEAGYKKSQSPNPNSWVTVEDKTSPPMTACENELGMTEDALRYCLFSRQGLQERLYHKLANITGVQLVSKEDLIEVFRLWVEANYEGPTTKTTNKTSKRTKKAVTAKAVTD